MPFFHHRTFKLLALAASGLLAVSCSESKASQCNRLVEVANRVVTDVQTVTQNASPQDIEAMTTIAETTAQAQADMEALELTDERLQAYQSRFVAMYGDTSQATRDLVAAAGEEDANAAQQAFEDLQSATSQEGPLVDEVNTYCAGGAAN